MERVRRVRFDMAKGALTLEPGAVTTFGYLQGLVQASEDMFIRPVAVNLLARRDHSKRELITKLQRRGFSRAASERAVEEMEERGYQSDRRSAESWVRGAMRKSGKSRAFLLKGLTEHGHSRTLAEEVVSDYAAEHPGCFRHALEVQLLRAVRNVTGNDTATLEELPGMSEQIKKTVISRLLRRGFSTNEIQQHFR